MFKSAPTTFSQIRLVNHHRVGGEEKAKVEKRRSIAEVRGAVLNDAVARLVLRRAVVTHLKGTQQIFMGVHFLQLV